MRYAAPGPAAAATRAQTGEQRVARRVAEGVVVGLEAVEVVENERARRARFERALEVRQQPAAVAQAGQRVGQGFAARVVEDRQVGEEGHREAPDHRQQRGPGQAHREQVQVAEVVGDQQREREQREQQRQHERPAPVERPSAHRSRARPGRDGHEQHRGRPAGLEHRAGLPAAGRVLEEVEAVAHPEGDAARGQRAPRGARLPAGQRDAAGDQADEHEVGHRVGEIGGDLQRLAAGRPQHALEDDRRRKRGDRERASTPSTHSDAWKRGTRARTMSTNPT